MPNLLPHLTSLNEYRPLYRQESVWLPAMQAICARHKLDASRLSFAPPGSNVVFWVADHQVIKLFAPFWQADAAKEARWLDALAANKAIHTPRVLARGELENWPYLVLSRVPGTPLDELWDTLSSVQRLTIAESLGQALAALHATAVPGLENDRPAWERWRSAQIEQCAAAQAANGASQPWLTEIAAWAASLPAPALRRPNLVLVNGDLNPEHLFCEQGPRGWEVSGLIDFGDAIAAHPFYDFVRPGFILQESPLLRSAMLRAYGFAPAELTAALTQELFSHVLIHQFANVPETLASLNSPPANLAELEQALWGF